MFLNRSGIENWSEYFIYPWAPTGELGATQRGGDQVYQLGLLSQSTIDCVVCLFLAVLETRKSKMKVPNNCVPGESSHPNLQMGAFLWHSHMVEKNSSDLNSSSHTATDPIMELYPCDFNQTWLPPRGPTLVGRASIYEFGETHSAHSTGLFIHAPSVQLGALG